MKKITPLKWHVEKYPEGAWEWDFGPYPDFAKLTKPCLEHGIMKTVRVGGSTLRLVKLKELIDLYVGIWRKIPIFSIAFPRNRSSQALLLVKIV